jgi:hypothetical protein
VRTYYGFDDENPEELYRIKILKEYLSSRKKYFLFFSFFFLSFFIFSSLLAVDVEIQSSGNETTAVLKDCNPSQLVSQLIKETNKGKESFDSSLDVYRSNLIDFPDQPEQQKDFQPFSDKQKLTLLPTKTGLGKPAFLLTNSSNGSSWNEEEEEGVRNRGGRGREDWNHRRVADLFVLRYEKNVLLFFLEGFSLSKERIPVLGLFLHEMEGEEEGEGDEQGIDWRERKMRKRRPLLRSAVSLPALDPKEVERLAIQEVSPITITIIIILLIITIIHRGSPD